MLPPPLLLLVSIVSPLPLESTALPLPPPLLVSIVTPPLVESTVLLPLLRGGCCHRCLDAPVFGNEDKISDHVWC